jgi:hypothetical protein
MIFRLEILGIKDKKYLTRLMYYDMKAESQNRQPLLSNGSPWLWICTRYRTVGSSIFYAVHAMLYMESPKRELQS